MTFRMSRVERDQLSHHTETYASARAADDFTRWPPPRIMIGQFPRARVK
jgi:hypothetical protein